MSEELTQDEIDALLSGVPAEKGESENEKNQTDSAAKNTSGKKGAGKVDEADSEAKKKRVAEWKKRAEQWEKKHPGVKDHVLSQDEIDQLLKAISKVPDDDEYDLSDSNKRRKIKIYDFKRPDRFSKEQIRYLVCIFETVCRDMTTQFSARLRSLCHFRVASVDQLTYEEFIRSVPTPTTMACCKWETEKAVLEIDPCLTHEFLYSMVSDKIDRFEVMLDEIGGLTDDLKYEIMDTARGVFHGSKIIRDLTDTELFFMDNFVAKPIYKLITQSFNEWQERSFFFTQKNQKKKSELVLLQEPSDIWMENNPQFALVAGPAEMGLLITIEGKICDEEGMLNVFLPYEFVKNVLIEKGILMKATTNGSKFGLEIVPGNSGVSLGEFNVPEGEKVEKGMIIELNKLAGEEVDLYDKKTGNIFAKGEVVVIDENFGVRVTDVL